MQPRRVADGLGVISVCWSESERGLRLLSAALLHRFPWPCAWDREAIDPVTHSSNDSSIKDKPNHPAFKTGPGGASSARNVREERHKPFSLPPLKCRAWLRAKTLARSSATHAWVANVKAESARSDLNRQTFPQSPAQSSTRRGANRAVN